MGLTFARYPILKPSLKLISCEHYEGCGIRKHQCHMEGNVRFVNNEECVLSFVSPFRPLWFFEDGCDTQCVRVKYRKCTSSYALATPHSHTTFHQLAHPTHRCITRADQDIHKLTLSPVQFWVPTLSGRYSGPKHDSNWWRRKRRRLENG